MMDGMRTFAYGAIFLLLLFFCFAFIGGWLTSQPTFAKSGGDANQVSPSELERHVRFLTGDIHRSFPRTSDLDKAADYVKKEFASTGGQVSEQAYRVDDETFRNVAVVFGPATVDKIVIGAHYDAYGSLPGADDNASGTAALIELGKRLGKASLNRRVEVVAYTLEEPPNFRTENMGSWHHAQALKQGNQKVRAMICLEMVGYFSDKSGTQRFPAPGLGAIYGDTGNFIAVVGDYSNISLTRRVKKEMIAAGSLPVRSINAPAGLPGIDFSDHLSYWANDYPAVMITDSAFYRNSNYHTTSDTAEKLDYKKMAQVVDQLYAAVLNIANE
jgi:Zn-dependent M28 family amino/carboxypeptidase